MTHNRPRTPIWRDVRFTANSGHASAPGRLHYSRTAWSQFVQCDCWIWSSCAALQATHIRMGSIGLLYATQTRAPHCSHSQLNDGVDGIGTSSTRGQASTSRNSKSGMHQRYTRNLFGPCAKSARLPSYHNREVPSRGVIGITLVPPKADIEVGMSAKCQ